VKVEVERALGPARRSVRLPGYDYAWPGWYAVTICAHERQALFGEVVDGEARLGPAGEIVRAEWLRTAALRPELRLDAFVIMPNHLHGIIVIDEATEARSATASASASHAGNELAAFRSPAGTLGAVVRGFKAATTSRIRGLWSQLDARVWQWSFYEHIIDDEDDLAHIREYIANNPRAWEDDGLHVTQTTRRP
jgi:REP element-mobilizing transposase RayT